MEIRYPEIGICGLSCRLCPHYQTQAASKCRGCKSTDRIAVGCPFITCALNKFGIEYCGDCEQNDSCEKWGKNREIGKTHDSFKSYQKLEDDISFIRVNGIEAYDEQQKIREAILTRLLDEFNEGRSKSYYCIAATIMQIDELQKALEAAKIESKAQSVKDKSRIMHLLLDNIALRKGYQLRLRK